MHEYSRTMGADPLGGGAPGHILCRDGAMAVVSDKLPPLRPSHRLRLLCSGLFPPQGEDTSTATTRSDL